MHLVAWVEQNHEWLFSGILTLATVSLIGALLRWGYNRWRERGNPRQTDWSVQQSSGKQVADRPFSAKLPAFMLRLLYKPGGVQRKVKLDLRGDNPGTVSLSAPIPSVDLYFQITNLGPIDLVLDRLLIDVWFGQPTFSAALLHRYAIPAGDVTDNLSVRQPLTESQKAQITAFEAANGNYGTIHIYMHAYFESKLGRLDVRQTVDRRKL